MLTRGDHLQEEVAELQQEFESRLASAEKTVRQNGRRLAGVTYTAAAEAVATHVSRA
jgi:hypothetical protein